MKTYKTIPELADFIVGTLFYFFAACLPTFFYGIGFEWLNPKGFWGITLALIAAIPFMLFQVSWFLCCCLHWDMDYNVFPETAAFSERSHG